MSSPLAQRTALIVGVGGLGCPAALALCRAGVGRVVLVDEDEVDETNLHRQILYGPEHVGQPKLHAAREALVRDGAAPSQVGLIEERLLPDNARRLVASADVILEGSDNYATKFLAADAARLEGRMVVHGAAVGWRATVMAVGPAGAPCYRCLFEDLPSGDEHPNCATAGVMGPVVGIAGALMADLAIRLLQGEDVQGTVISYDGKADRLRSLRVVARPDCALCGQRPTIGDIAEARYLGATCAA